MIRNFNENFFFFYYKFSQIEKVLEQIKEKKFDGILLDLGMSNTQLKNPERVFHLSLKARWI